MKRFLLNVLIISMVFSSVIFAKTQENILVNSSFEDGMEGWKMRSGSIVTVDTETVKDGEKSIKLEVAPDETQAYIVQRQFPVEGGQIYYMSFWAYTDNIPVRGVDSQLYLTVEWYDKDVKYIAGKSQYFTPTVVKNRWSKYEHRFVAPADAVTANYLIRLRGPGSRAWIDNAFFALDEDY